MIFDSCRYIRCKTNKYDSKYGIPDCSRKCLIQNREKTNQQNTVKQQETKLISKEEQAEKGNLLSVRMLLCPLHSIYVFYFSSTLLYSSQIILKCIPIYKENKYTSPCIPGFLPHNQHSVYKNHRHNHLKQRIRSNTNCTVNQDT